jgi:hypothetical protein
MTSAQQQAELGRRLSVIEVKLTKAWDRLTALPPDRADSEHVLALVKQFEALSDARVRLRRACGVPA